MSPAMCGTPPTSGALLPNLKSIFWFRLAQFWGAYQGFRHPGPVTEQLRQTFYYPRELRQEVNVQERNIIPINYEKTTPNT